jgi:hypothetical protein
MEVEAGEADEDTSPHTYPLRIGTARLPWRSRVFRYLKASWAILSLSSGPSIVLCSCHLMVGFLLAAQNFHTARILCNSKPQLKGMQPTVRNLSKVRQSNSARDVT